MQEHNWKFSFKLCKNRESGVEGHRKASWYPLKCILPDKMICGKLKGFKTAGIIRGTLAAISEG